MTAAQVAKARGLKSLRQVADISGVPYSTLNDWAKHKPSLFRAVVIGVATQLAEGRGEQCGD